jgi:N-acetylglucosaminyldiphosphoundecaprenol N-acetyl-beta-D-mannosaminyltransferase
VPFDNVTTEEAIGLIEQMVASKRPHYLATANVDFLVQAQRDTELRRILCDAHMVLCDGTPLLWASRLLGNPLPERVAGADIVPLLIRVAAERGYRIFFLGASPEAAEQAVANLREQYPQLQIAGHYSPPYKPLLEMDHEEIKRRIRAGKPDLLFVGFGCPKQEKWMAMHYVSLGVPVVVGVGATIDFLAGRVKRAPVWMRRGGVEWIFRLAQEPRRLMGRYMTDMWVFGWKIVAQWWRMHSRRKGPAQGQESLAVEDGQVWQEIVMPEQVDMEMVCSHVHLTEQVLAKGRHCLLDMSRVRFVDSTGLGLLVRLQKRLREQNLRLILMAPSNATMRTLTLVHLEELFCVLSDRKTALHWITAETEAGLQTNVWTTAGRDLRWQGEITAANAEEVWRKTMAQLRQLSGTSPLVIDLSDVTFMDSSGLGVMVRARKAARQQGKHLVFSGLPPIVRNVLRVSRLEEFLLGEEPLVGAEEKACLSPASAA